MFQFSRCFLFRVTFLTLCSLSLLLPGCSLQSMKENFTHNPCKNRAYTQMVLLDYINSRYHSKSPVRIGVIPFSVPANFATRSAEEPGVDYQIAWELQRQLLQSGQLSIVEMFNRLDWPGKKEEFYSGNFGAITFGRQAGYDIIIVGSIPTTAALRELSAFTKVIEVESGITIFYGMSSVDNPDPQYQREGTWSWFAKDRPDKLQFGSALKMLGRCVAENVLDEEPAG